MKAAVFHGPKLPLSIEDVELDKPQDREVLIKTVASGVCHSDLHFVDGLYPYPAPAVLGHEAAGIVEEVGKQVTYVKPGDHVICCLSVFCGYCEQCMSGHPNRCSNKAATQRKPGDKPRISQKGQPVNQFLDISSYCEKMLLHENAVVKIREDMPLDRAALIGCGVTTGVGAVLNTAKIEPGSTVAVFGAGGVGLAAIQGARIAGARKIIAVDMFEGKLAMAKRLGATDTVDASSSDPVDEIRKTDRRRRRRLLLRSDRPQEGRRAGVPRDQARRHRDRHRHDSRRPEGRARRLHVPDRAQTARLATWARTASASTCPSTSTSTCRAASTSTT